MRGRSPHSKRSRTKGYFKSSPFWAIMEEGDRMSEPSQTETLIVLFDGVCNLCSSWVRFCLPRDRSGTIRFGALQEPPSQALLKQHGLSQDKFDSIVVIEGAVVYQRSAAVIRILRRLGPFWSSLGFMSQIVPQVLRDGVYDRIARSRYRWFGKTEACYLPTSEERKRFL